MVKKMIYNDLITHNKILSYLQSTIENNTIPNAFLFYGQKGIGKIAYAIEFSASLLCLNPNDNWSCGQCNSCMKIKNNQHGNINYILPTRNKNNSKNDTSLGKEEIDLIQNNMTEKLKNPYHDISDKKIQSIPIKSIREIRKKISLGSLTDSYNINIITEAEKLCFPRQEAANALLKILEEPNEKNLFILCTSNFSKMIDTISSRCIKLHFPNLDIISMESYLIEKYNINHKKADVISNISNGDMIFANEISDKFENLMKDLENSINIILEKNINEWINFIAKFRNDNYSFILILDLIELFFSDLIILKTTQNYDNIKLKNFIEKINFCSKKYADVDWSKCITLLNDCKNNINKNAYFNFVTTGLILELNKIFMKDSFLIDELNQYQL